MLSCQQIDIIWVLALIPAWINCKSPYFIYYQRQYIYFTLWITFFVIVSIVINVFFCVCIFVIRAQRIIRRWNMLKLRFEIIFPRRYYFRSWFNMINLSNTNWVNSKWNFSSCVAPHFSMFFFLFFYIVWFGWVPRWNALGRQSVQLWLMRVHAVLQSLSVSIGVFVSCLCVWWLFKCISLAFYFSRHWMQNRV